MVAHPRKTGCEIAPEAVAEITRLYESGLYVQACNYAAQLPFPWDWKGTAACLIGGRLANNVHAPRLARALHARAWRADKTSPEAAYYFAFSLLSWRGPLATWKFLRGLPPFPAISAEQRADLLMLQAHTIGLFRDFETAAKLFGEAEAAAASRPWFWVEKGSIHELQDGYEEALACSRRALEIRPWFRPAVQSVAHQLQLLGRDEEALAFLREALLHIESSSVAGQLAVLETELGLHQDALESWRRVRTLAPWMEEKLVDWWEARLSDASYFAGDLAGAADAAARSKNPFHEKLAERLRAPAPEAKRVFLPVGFVRQHHFTCAPATLSALSRYWQMPVDHLALAAAICYDGTPDHIERHWAGENGWHAREFRVTWDTLVALLDRGIPFTLTTVETQSAHLQAVIGYDSFRGTLLIRDPYERIHGEWLATEFLERYVASGPRGMLLVPLAEMPRLEGIELPDAVLYDAHYQLRRALHAYDRAAAQGHFDELERLDATHRLTLRARLALASYDGSLTRQLAAIEELLVQYPKNGSLLWSKLIALRNLNRRGDYQQFLRDLAAQKDSDIVFWREWSEELRQDARRRHEAHLLLLRALRYQPMDSENLRSAAHLYWDQREFAEATALYRLAATLRDKVEGYAQSYFLAARHLRETETALAMLVRRVEAFGEKSSLPVRLLFWALSALDRQPLAFEKLEAALRLHPEDGDLLLFAADAYARHSQPERGAELLRAAESRAPRATWLRTAANLADYRCDLAGALACWREILAAEPLDLGAQRAATRLLAETEGRAAALAHLRATCERFDHHIGLHELWVEWARTEGSADAEPMLRRLLALHPEHAWAHRELALVLSELNRHDEATAELDLAAALEPQAPSTDGVRAHAALQAGDLEKARTYARAALRLSIDYETAIRDLLAASPTFEEKRTAIAFIREELIRQVVFGDGLLAYRSVAFEIVEPADLLASLRDALAARPDLWHAWSAVVLQLADMQQFDEALALAQQATERFPLLPRLWVDLAQVHRARRERESEIAPLRRALQISPAWSRASQLLANTYERMGQYAEAARVLEQAIAAAPLDAFNYGTLANVLYHLGRRDEARQRLEHALKLEPGYNWAWDTLLSLSHREGAENRAVILARQIADLRPGEARSWFVLAQVLTAAPLAERLAALSRAFALNPRFTDAHDLRAVLFAEAKRYDDAVAACAPASYGGKIPSTLRGRAAWVEAQRGRTRAAIAQMRQVVASEPDYYWGWNMLAEWSCADHDFAAAEEAARKMARLAPRSAIPLGYLADIQIRNKQVEEAYATLRRAYEIDPNYGFAGYTLFDRHLEKGELEDAEKVLATITTHLPGPRATAGEVRLLAQRRKKDAAFLAFRKLLNVPADQTVALQIATDALVAARWSAEVESALASVLHLPDTNPEVGALWVRRFAAREQWGHRKRLYQLSPRTEIGRRARIAYIEELARCRKGWMLNRLISREGGWLRSSASAWGTMGYAYVHLRRWHDTVAWMKDWRQRNDLAPWMLVNLATAYRQLGKESDALAANQRALQIPPDGTVPQHKLWLALEAALAGNIPTVVALREELREHELGAYEQALLALIKALHAMHVAPPTARREILADRRRDLEQRRLQGAFADPVLNTSHRRTMAVLSRLGGDRWYWLRKWLPESRPSQPRKTRSKPGNLHPGVIMLIVMCALSVLRMLNFDNATTTTTPPFPAAAPAPIGAPKLRGASAPPSLNQPIVIQLGPSDIRTPIPILPQATPPR